ncbi:peroxidase-like [Daktulosphaira vitifoliae]|uniref:peroxidase-like n=1 Tax=Daktulosphaira vitifoliae TaxID=58002 RepID=UPI0021A994AC|nr:peroxidase-like [Daktulosphaira vitifoliae]
MIQNLMTVLFGAWLFSAVQTQPQQPFLTELFPEQLQQQQLQFRLNDVQVQLQQVKQALEAQPQDAVHRQSLMLQYDEFMRVLQEIQQQMLVLQQRIQERLSGKVKFQPVPLIDVSQFQQQKMQVPIPIQQKPLKNQSSGSCSTVSGEPGTCKPLVNCLSFYAELPELKKQPCKLAVNEFGVCCPARNRKPDNQLVTGVIRAPPPPPVIIPPLTSQQLNDAAVNAIQQLNERQVLVTSLFTKRILLPTGSAAAWHQELFQTTNETLSQGEQAQKSVDASLGLVNNFNLTRDQGTFALPNFSILDTVLGDTCPRTSFCQPHKYRSTDGSCNNIQHEQWGRASTALQRILPPKYADGVNLPRSKASDGSPLPSARVVSITFTQDVDAPSENYTMLLMQWGQFLDHDMTQTPISRGQMGSGITCCRNGREIDVSLQHPDCFPIEIPRNDQMFGPFNERCMEFVRSLPAPRPECNFGPREQMNQITAYLDGSSIYGSSLSSQQTLRTFQSGMMQFQNIRGKHLLPANPSECSDDTGRAACFRAGDARVNEQLDLAIMHTIWLREHNRIAMELSRLNPRWSDEALFQETRRIVIAQIQHITYNEFLPIILGRTYMNKFGLSPEEVGWTRKYDSELNAGITNSFAGAAYRFGHTLIQGNIHGYGKFGNIRENLVLSKQHFAPFSIYKDGALDDFIRGLSFQSSQKFDRFFTKEVTDHLFQGNLNFGLDLVALNVQRGRDHGLPPYNDWREVCGYKRAKSWNDLEEFMEPQTITRLARLYNSVDDIDLYIGGVAEKSMADALLGPTFVCIVGDQFSRLRRGDRFFYEEAGQLSAFDQVQLQELRKSSLARVICDNSDEMALIQPLAFMKPSFLNQRVACASSSIPKVDLRAWAGEETAVP